MLPLRCRQSLHLSQFNFAGCKTATVLRIGKSGNARAVATAVPVEGSNKQKQPVRSLPQGGKRFDSVDAEARRPAQQRGLLLLWTIAGARKLGIRWIPCFGAPFSFAEGRFCVDSQNSHPAFLGDQRAKTQAFLRREITFCAPFRTGAERMVICHEEKRKKTVHPQLRRGPAVCRAVQRQRNAHHGGLSAHRSRGGLGRAVPALSGRGPDLH